jgi:hypothetical protein
VKPFNSTAEVTAAMGDPRYKDTSYGGPGPAYRAEVEARLAISPNLGASNVDNSRIIRHVEGGIGEDSNVSTQEEARFYEKIGVKFHGAHGAVIPEDTRGALKHETEKLQQLDTIGRERQLFNELQIIRQRREATE